MEIGEAERTRLFGEGVDIRGMYLGTKAATVAESEIIGDDDQKVGTFLGWVKPSGCHR